MEHTQEPKSDSEPESEKALTRTSHSSTAVGLAVGSTSPLATMDDTQFEIAIEQAAKARKRLMRIQKEAMQKGVDWGTIPGTQNPTLLKPGSEILIAMAGGVPTYDVPIRILGDGVDTPAFEYRITCVVRDKEGAILGVGMGSCNTHEKRYRYRRARLQCPECGERAIAQNRTSKVFFCSKRDGGCGKNFAVNGADWKQLASQPAFEINPDPFDLDNTILKIAKKRAKVDAALEVGRASGTFTQDLEELEPEWDQPPPPGDEGTQKASTKKKEPPKRRAAPAAKTGARDSGESRDDNNNEPPPPGDEEAPPQASKPNGEDVKPGIPVPSLDEVKQKFRSAGLRMVSECDGKIRGWKLFEIEDRHLDDKGKVRFENLNEREIILVDQAIETELTKEEGI